MFWAGWGEWGDREPSPASSTFPLEPHSTSEVPGILGAREKAKSLDDSQDPLQFLYSLGYVWIYIHNLTHQFSLRSVATSNSVCPFQVPALTQVPSLLAQLSVVLQDHVHVERAPYGRGLQLSCLVAKFCHFHSPSLPTHAMVTLSTLPLTAASLDNSRGSLQPISFLSFQPLVFLAFYVRNTATRLSLYNRTFCVSLSSLEIWNVPPSPVHRK